MNEVAQQVPDTFSGLFFGYTVFWALIAVYVVRLGLKVRRLEKRQ